MSFGIVPRSTSRAVPITNKKRIESLIRIYGDDSDYVRIRVLGQFPRMGLMEFFSAADIEAAMSPDSGGLR